MILVSPLRRDGRGGRALLHPSVIHFHPFVYPSRVGGVKMQRITRDEMFKIPHRCILLHETHLTRSRRRRKRCAGASLLPLAIANPVNTQPRDVSGCMKLEVGVRVLDAEVAVRDVGRAVPTGVAAA